MKIIKITLLLASMAFGLSAVAQDKPKGKDKIYTPEQLEMLKAQKASVKENREEFKSSLSNEQLAIMENKELSVRERREALRASFTDAQKTMMETNRSEIKALKDAFRATITEEQKQLIRERRSKMKKRMENIKDRKLSLIHI